MSEKTNIYEIAQELGISTTTVSRAISGKGRLSEATRQRVLEYIASRNLDPCVRKRKYTDKKTGNILVTIPAEKDYALLPYFMEILSSVYDYCVIRGFQVMMAKTGANDIDALKTIISKHKVDGVVLTRTITDALDIKFLKERGVPFVAIGSYDDKTVSQVDVDQMSGCRDLTSILLRMGIRKIALFCADRTHVVTKSRLKGFLQAYEDNDLDFDPQMIFDGAGEVFKAEQLTEEMLKKGVECILCMDDNICINVLNTLRKNGVRVPQDIRIASFYNSQVLNEYYPPISCVDFDIKELGTMAARVLLEALDGEEKAGKITMGYNVILKESTK
ncbi:MAG TPA: LacI family transcriptional regulator [Roseburia sp.]|nr:LacI family transcriptional regulator [Roseburia sp.]